MKKPQIIVLLFIGLAIAVGALYLVQTLQQPQVHFGAIFPTPTPTQTAIESIEIKGEIICLPHKDTSGPQTLECAFGIKDNKTGLNYGLAFPDSGELPPAQTGEIVVIKGNFTPVTDTIYDITGKIDVESVQN